LSSRCFVTNNEPEMSATLHTTEQPWKPIGRGGFTFNADVNKANKRRQQQHRPSFTSNVEVNEPDRSSNDVLVKEPNPPFDALSLSEPESLSEVLRAWVQAGRFHGYLHIPDAPFNFPAYPFTITSRGMKITLESHPTGPWPQILIVLSSSSYSKPVVEKFLLRPSSNTVEAEIFYTRALYTLCDLRFCFLASEVTSNGEVVGIPFSFETFGEEDVRGILHRAKLARKLKFIEHLYKVRFTLPEDITPEQVRRIETLFRGITEGEFVSRGKAITVPVKAVDTNLSEPPFSQIGPYTQLLGIEEAVLDHPQLLDVGPVYFSLKRASVANRMVLASIREGENQWVRFEVLDNQITYRFERYASRDRHRRVRQRLNQFYSQLKREEPPELAVTLTQLLMSDVSAAEAVQIAVGWLEYHNLPDRFSPQEPVLDESRACWRVALYVVYASGKSAPVGELLIELKTGSVVEEPSAETLYQQGIALAENFLRVG